MRRVEISVRMESARLYVISLATRNARRAQIAARLKELGLDAILIDAVDGREGLGDHAADVDRAAANAQQGRPLTDGELACALSHRAVYRDFLASDAQWAVVLEDDALIGAEFVAYLQSGAYARAPMTLLHHSNARVFGARPLMEGVVAHDLAMSPFMAVGYALNRNCAAALDRAQTPVQRLADWPLDLSDLGAVAVTPQIVGHPPMGAGSALAAGRAKPKPPMGRMLSPSYLRRKWRKLRARKIS
ncbi:Beta-1,4-galactosyltransferase [Candidatus Rhodobacter oscarellae]|uniref:Beta-1,4-galactosyltransferase n=1 Tax=Candidatus Rhodobacter oscarellae TaxID=1675527 RepID=A0A0J9E202_9RHOB|nr:glycosyltransferase family 25 protein [Candidatus Rhodobacter lobularis]KMW56755.1 Beta-1,4-galactosyltransferase [Candidatus Rhodobacter lobularis]